MSMMSRVAAASAVAVASAVAASPAGAGVVFYQDLTSFDAAASTKVVETFDGFCPTDTPVPFFVGNGNTYTGLGTTPFCSNVYVSAPGATNFGLPATASTVLTANGDEDFRVSFGKPGTAVGFDTYLNAFGPATIQLEGADGLLGTFTLSHAANMVGFFGAIADAPITAIRWTSVNGRTVNTGIDNIRVGSGVAGPTVPEPGTLALLATGGLGLAGGAIRKRRKATSAD